jgi:hypothetical protein
MPYDPSSPPVSLQEVIAAFPADTAITADTPVVTAGSKKVTVGEIASLVTPSVDELVAAGKTTGILGSGEVGVWDATTQANIAALVAEGWPLANIVISYVAATGEPAAVTAANVSVTPSISSSSLIGELLAASVSVSPTISEAALIGILAADNVSVTPSITTALLTSEGSVDADSMSVTPVISEAALIGALAAANVSVTPQIGAAAAVGVLLADNVSVTPQISAAELTEASASPVVADNVSVTPTISTAELVGVLAANNVSITPTIGAAELSGASAPAAPVITATAGNLQVSVAFTAPASTTDIDIWALQSAGTPSAATIISTGTQIQNAGITTPKLHTGLTNGQQWWYVARARNAIGSSVDSNVVSATPASVVLFSNLGFEDGTITPFTLTTDEWGTTGATAGSAEVLPTGGYGGSKGVQLTLEGYEDESDAQGNAVLTTTLNANLDQLANFSMRVFIADLDISQTEFTLSFVTNTSHQSIVCLKGVGYDVAALGGVNLNIATGTWVTVPYDIKAKLIARGANWASVTSVVLRLTLRMQSVYTEGGVLAQVVIDDLLP